MDDFERKQIEQDNAPVHGFFGLSYAAYLVVPRSILQSMPVEWQRRFVICLTEAEEKISWPQHGEEIEVRLKNETGQYVEDSFRDYDRGRRRVELKVFHQNLTGSFLYSTDEVVEESEVQQ